MTDFIMPVNVYATPVVGRGTPLRVMPVRSVTVRFDDPQFGSCGDCGSRIARLGERESWHHIDRTIEHRAEGPRA